MYSGSNELLLHCEFFFSGDVAESFNRRVGGVKREYTHCIMRQLHSLQAKLKDSFFVVHCLRAGNKPTHKLGRFLNMADVWGVDGKKAMDEALAHFILHGTHVNNDVSYLLQLPSMPKDTIREEVILLSSLPNYHWWQYVKVVGGVCNKPTVRFTSHVLFCPDEQERDDGTITTRFVPTSPRNRLMYFTTSGNHDTFLSTVQQLIAVEMGKQPMLVGEENAEVVEAPPRKKRRHAGAKLLKLNKVSLSEELGLDLDTELNCQDENRRLFSKFAEQIASDGVIQWRQHSEESDVVVLNDYDPSTGSLMPSSFVHVSATKAEDGELLVHCTCETYNMIQKALVQKYHLLPGSDSLLDVSNTCMHSRFYKEHLLSFWDLVGSTATLNQVHGKVQFSLDDMDPEVLLLGQVIPAGVTKFSVRGEGESFSQVTISFRMGQCWARCWLGVCSAQARNKKKIPKTIPLQNTSELCTHLDVFHRHLERIKELFPEHFSGVGEAEEPHVLAEDGGNVEDQGLPPQQPCVFDRETGLWNYPSFSQHQPREMFDPELIRYTFKMHGFESIMGGFELRGWVSSCYDFIFSTFSETEIRNSLVTVANLNTSSGLYHEITLEPAAFQENGDPKDCPCGVSTRFVGLGFAFHVLT